MTYKPLHILFITFIIVLFSHSNLLAGVNKGDKLYNEGNYFKAINKYKSAYEKDPQNFIVVEKIANTYMEMGEYSKAELWFWKAYRANGLSEQGSLSYMKALISNSKYQIAEDFCVDYRSKYPQSTIKCPNQNAFRSLMFSDKFEVNLMNFNTSSDDVNPTVYQENLYLLSAATKKSPVVKVINLPELVGDNKAEGTTFRRINSVNPSNGIAFHPYTGEMFYAMGNKNGLSDGNIYKSYVNTFDAYSTLFEDKLPFPNNKDYSIFEVTFNAAGTIMYFSSDMDGGYGGSDLWKCTYENGVLGVPVNLGQQINTFGNERYPTFHQGDLYFSSDGLLGLGSLDIFRVTKQAEEWGIPENLRSPVNSNFNDYAITFKNDLEGFFTSDRIGGEGGNDIYSFRKRAEIMTVLVYDKDTKEPLANMPITLGSGEVVTTDENGVCSVEYTEDGLENIVAVKDGYAQNDLKFNEEGYSVLVPMESQKGIKFMVQVLNKKSGLPMDGVFVGLNDFESTTDAAGNTFWMIYPDMEYTLTAYDAKNKSVLNEKLVKNFSTKDAETPDFWTATVLLE